MSGAESRASAQDQESCASSGRSKPQMGKIICKVSRSGENIERG